MLNANWDEPPKIGRTNFTSNGQAGNQPGLPQMAPKGPLTPGVQGYAS